MRARGYGPPRPECDVRGYARPRVVICVRVWRYGIEYARVGGAECCFGGDAQARRRARARRGRRGARGRGALGDRARRARRAGVGERVFFRARCTCEPAALASAHGARCRADGRRAGAPASPRRWRARHLRARPGRAQPSRGRPAAAIHSVTSEHVPSERGGTAGHCQSVT
jgi:hypothetical protein